MNRVEQIVSHLTAAKAGADAQLVSIMKQQGVAVLTMNFPPVNSFHPSLQAALEKAISDVYADASVKAVVITGKSGFFMAGADIPTIQALQNNPSSTRQEIIDYLKRGHKLFNMIESGPKPTVAAVNGPALGGGCELAIACNARVAVPTAQFGLPELNLGIIPGLAGTQRLPRLIGLQLAVTNTMSAKNLKAPQAQKAGLVDLVVKPDQLIMAAGKLALDLADGKRPVRRSLLLADKIPHPTDAKRIIEEARYQASKKTKNVPHPGGYLDAVWEGVVYGGERGIQKEMEVFADLVKTPSAKSLVHFFLSTKATAKVPGVPEKSKLKFKKVAVIGGGTMGVGIALVYLMKGHEVILKEVNEKALLAAVERILTITQQFLKRRKLPVMGAEQILRGLTPQITYDGFEQCDLVIEAVLENVPLKQKIFGELEKICKKECILATNTSTIDLDQIGLHTNAKDRIIGLHFFSPAHVMPLLEIVRTKNTSNETIAACVQSSKQIGKTPVVVGNCVGFTANRIFFPYGQAAAFLVDSGVCPYRIDAALEKWGMPMGVFKMSDLSGVDIFMHVSIQINGAYGDRCYNSSVGKHLSAAGRLGQKTGAGYYKYVKGKTIPDPKGIADILKKTREDAKLPQIKDITDEEIVQMVLYPVVNESTRVMQEGHVVRESDVDVCTVFGYGFPAYRGGVMFWARLEGLKNVNNRLKSFSEKYGASVPAARSFFAPSAHLAKLSA